MKRHQVLSLVVLLCLVQIAAYAADPAQIAKSITIYRDNYGVPHIYGPTDAACAFGFMYAQAEDNFWQIEDSYIRSLGRDLARALGSEGYISALHRSRVGPFSDMDAISLDFLQESVHKTAGSGATPWLITALDGIPAAAIQEPDAA